MYKIAIESLGCSKNLNDSEIMAGILEKNGYILTDKFEAADIIVVNTCGFIESAKEESIDTILEMADYKKSGSLKYLIVTGCMAQRYSEQLQNEIPEIDLILGTTSFPQIAQAVEGLDSQGKTSIIEDIDKDIAENLPKKKLTPDYMAYVKIAEGCDNKCTYCIIPKLRGKYRSRKLEDIVSESEELAKSGVKEVILIAQDTSRYGTDIYGKKTLPELLRRLSKIEAIEWIRVLYTYPEEIDSELIDAVKSSSKICSYFDMPVQHSSNRILKLMNRKTTREDMLDKISMIRKSLPDAVIRTTLIVGFPQESSEDFEDLKDFVREAKFDRLGAFTYSREEGTAAANLSGQVDEDEKLARREEIMLLQQEISLENNMKRVGETCRVLVEEKLEEGLYSARSQKEAPEIDGLVYVKANHELQVGSIVDVRIVQATEYDVMGETI